MRFVDLIVKTRDGEELTTEEINYFVDGFTRGDIPDYQASAWAMAVTLNGMTPRETTDLTLAMAHSGDTIDLSHVAEITVDKHSTGGVGDKTTLVVEPVVAACGIPVGKVSGRGLGFSGGTLDKLESIPGYRTDLTIEEFLSQLKEIGLVLTGQTGDLAPADGKLYALRDVSGTVPSMPLIASSIMCKKIAGGAQRIVLDVKTGHGAFMETLEDARHLAQLMVQIGELAGRKTVALLSDMNQPLGNAVGNSLELIEAIETLHGHGPDDFFNHSLEVAMHMLVLGEKAKDLADARNMAEKVIKNGNAWEKFCELVEAQGGDASFIDDIDKLPVANFVDTVPAPGSGYVAGVNARVVGETAVLLGAGRAEKGAPVDHSVGIVVHKKVGDTVKEGDPLFTIHANQAELLEQSQHLVLDAYSFSNKPVKPLPLFYGVID